MLETRFDIPLTCFFIFFITEYSHAHFYRFSNL